MCLHIRRRVRRFFSVADDKGSVLHLLEGFSVSIGFVKMIRGHPPLERVLHHIHINMTFHSAFLRSA